MKEIRIDVTKQTAEELALADTIVAGNPARFIRRIDPRPECSATDDTTVQLGLDSCGD